MVLFRTKLHVYSVSSVCIKNQIIRINNQKREVTSTFTLKHFFPLHLPSVTAGFSSCCSVKKSCSPQPNQPSIWSPHELHFPSHSSRTMEVYLCLPMCTVAPRCACFHVNEFRCLEVCVVHHSSRWGMSWVQGASPSVLAEGLVPCRLWNEWGPSVSPSSRLSLLVLILLHTGVGRAALHLRCCCLRGWLVSTWVRMSLTWDRLGSTSWRIFPIFTGALEGENRSYLTVRTSKKVQCFLYAFK